MARAEVLYNRALSPYHFLMGLSYTGVRPAPGQFVMLRISSGSDPLLRRPFGVFSLLEDERGQVTGITILYRVVGRGTQIMSEFGEGQAVDLLGPLGNGFPAPKEGERTILVAGGMGLAPLNLMALVYPESKLIFGARDGVEASVIDASKEYGLLPSVVTEDGSEGEKGLVTDLLSSALEGLDPASVVVHSCGPMGMLRAVSALMLEMGVKTYVSLENSMACGLGACLGCAVTCTGNGGEGEYRFVCSDGPVFESTDIDWARIRDGH